jgi:hypothetical protein
MSYRNQSGSYLKDLERMIFVLSMETEMVRNRPGARTTRARLRRWRARMSVRPFLTLTREEIR